MHLEKLFLLLHQIQSQELTTAAREEAEKVYAAAAELPAAQERIAVLEERLKKAMEREKAHAEQIEFAQRLHTDDKEAAAKQAATIRRLEAQVRELEGKIADMRQHPDVKAAELRRLEAQRAEIDGKIAAMKPPEPKPEEKQEQAEPGASTDSHEG